MRKIRVLVGKPGLDGHDRGAKVVAAALRDAGMEVIYTGLHQTADQVVEAAVQEDVDVVALSILSGAHMTLFPEVLEKMRERGIGDRLLTGGGIIPPEDMETLARQGVGKLFGPGTSTQDIAAYIHEWCASRFGAAEIAPLTERRGSSAMPVPTAAEVAHHAPRAARPALAAPAPRRASAAPARKPARKKAGSNGSRPARATAAKRKPARRVAAKGARGRR
ncbi:MAG TPA: cobalamin B12-binding domain-containing protein [Candidatus Sulfotelmatobacter sp.]|nr:cobalamin B12-binding domain-containing protein [Candidatus Sulfotelmatobacter sp.]